MYDAASSILAQKLSQVQGVGQVIVGGSALPAVRVELNPTQLNAYGIGLEQVRTVLGGRQRQQPQGPIVRRPDRVADLRPPISFLKAKDYQPLIVAYRNGAPVRLSDIGAGDRFGRRHPQRRAGQRQAGGPDHHLPPAGREHHRHRGSHHALLPQLQASIPPAIKLTVVLDRTTTIRASVARRGDHPADLDRAGDPGGLLVPAQSARDAHSRASRCRCR